MQDKVVVGDQNYGLRGLTRFSDNEGSIIWPAWRAGLEQLVEFEIGSTGNKVIEGEFNEEDVVQGEVDASERWCAEDHCVVSTTPDRRRAEDHSVVITPLIVPTARRCRWLHHWCHR